MNFDLHQFILLVSAGLTVALICYIARNILNFIADTAYLVTSFSFGLIATLFVLPLSYLGFLIHAQQNGIEHGFKVVALILAMAAVFVAFSRYFYIEHKKKQS